MKKINHFTVTASIDYAERIRLEEELSSFHIKPWDPIHFGKFPRTDAADMIRRTMHRDNWRDVEEALHLLRTRKMRIALIENLPIGMEKKRVQTPTDGKHSFEKSNVSESIILGITHMLGGYVRIAENETIPFSEGIHEIVPSRNAKQGGSGNIEGIHMHVDRCFVPEVDIPEFTGLFCLREQQRPVTLLPQNPKTGFVAIEDFIKDIPEKIYRVMFKNEFKDPNSDAITPLLHGNPHDVSSLTATLDLNPGWMNGITPEAKEALEWLYANETVLRKNAFEIELKERQQVLFDDLKIIHYRTQYEMNDDAPFLNRWLQRWHMRLY